MDENVLFNFGDVILELYDYNEVFCSVDIYNVCYGCKCGFMIVWLLEQDYGYLVFYVDDLLIVDMLRLEVC